MKAATWNSAMSEAVLRLRQQLMADMAANRWRREAAEATGGLPVHEGWQGSFVLMPTGELLYFDSESGRAAPADEPPWALMAMARASRLDPVLEALMPQRSANATPCTTCSGTGESKFPESACGMCYGLGWRDQRMMASADPAGYLNVQLRRLDGLLRNEGRAPLNRSIIRFVLERNVMHEPARWPGRPGEGSPILHQTVASKDLMTEAEFIAMLAGSLEGGASYIHANLTRTRDGGEIIDIRAGDPIGNPWPSPNVSFTPHVVDMTITE